MLAHDLVQIVDGSKDTQPGDRHMTFRWIVVEEADRGEPRRRVPTHLASDARSRVARAHHEHALLGTLDSHDPSAPPLVGETDRQPCPAHEHHGQHAVDHRRCAWKTGELVPSQPRSEQAQRAESDRLQQREEILDGDLPP